MKLVLNGNCHFRSFGPCNKAEEDVYVTKIQDAYLFFLKYLTSRVRWRHENSVTPNNQIG